MDRWMQAAVWPLRIPFSRAYTISIVRRFAVHANSWRPSRNALERRQAAFSSRILRLVGKRDQWNRVVIAPQRQPLLLRRHCIEVHNAQHHKLLPDAPARQAMAEQLPDGVGVDHDRRALRAEPTGFTAGYERVGGAAL